MQRTENHWDTSILQLLNLFCQHLQTEHIIFPFLCAFFQNLSGIKVCFIRLISSVCPVYLISNIIIREFLRNGNVPRCSYDTLAVLYPANHTVNCTIFTAIQRIGIQEVKATDCWQLSSVILDVVEFIVEIMRTILINFLLTRNDVFPINACQIVHQGLCFRRCIFICQITGCRQFRINRFSQGQVVKLCPAPIADKFQFVFPSIQLDSCNVGLAEIRVVRQCQISSCIAVDIQFLRLCTAIRCIANVQVIHTSFFYIDSYLNGFTCIPHMNNLATASTCNFFYFCRNTGNFTIFKFILRFSGSGNATEKRADTNSIQCHCSRQAGSKYFLFDFHLKDPPFCF